MTVERPMPRLLLALGLCLLAAPAQASDVRALVASATTAPALAKWRAAAAVRQAGDYAGVLSALQGAEPDPLVAEWRADAHAAQGSRDKARAALAEVERASWPCEEGADPIAERLAEVHAHLTAAEDPAAAAKALLALTPDPDRLVAARAYLKQAGQSVEAVERRLLRDFPVSAPAKSMGAAAVKARLKTPADRLERAYKLLAAHANDDAAAEARALRREVGDEHAAACELLYIEGKAERKRRHYRPAQRTLEQARKVCTKSGQTDLALRSALLETHVRGIRGQIRPTRLVADWIQRTAPGHRYADDALAVHAGVLERMGRKKEARAAHLELIEAFPQSDHAPAAAWRLAFEALRSKAPQAADPLLARILETKDARPMAHARARYWRGQLAMARRDRVAAKAHFDAIVLDPSFYGWMALDRLAEAQPEWVRDWKASLLKLRDTARTPVAAADLGAAQPAVIRAARWAELGAGSWAEVELEGAACTVKTDAGRRALAVAYDALDLFPAAQRIARARQPEWRRGAVTPARMVDWRLAYSRPFTTELAAAAKAEKIEALFLTALSREESTFDPDIVSWAGATGLAQLMPATAIGAYADVFGGKLKMSRLTEPALNLRLGAHVLASGLRRFRKAEPLALAAYNGGPGLARRFVPAKALPFDLWVETMTVKETRRYVKRVTETWGIYRWLYDPAKPFISLPASIGGSEWKR